MLICCRTQDFLADAFWEKIFPMGTDPKKENKSVVTNGIRKHCNWWVCWAARGKTTIEIKLAALIQVNTVLTMNLGSASHISGHSPAGIKTIRTAEHFRKSVSCVVVGWQNNLSVTQRNIHKFVRHLNGKWKQTLKEDTPLLKDYYHSRLENLISTNNKTGNSNFKPE